VTPLILDAPHAKKGTQIKKIKHKNMKYKIKSEKNGR
jgi:hypothetical protein